MGWPVAAGVDGRYGAAGGCRAGSLVPREADSAARPNAGPVLQLKVRLLGVSPMVWRRLLVPAEASLRELHGILQVAMGWEGIHLFQFHLRAVRYGSLELSASSPEVTLANFRLRTGSRFIYEYDLNTPWRHEVRSSSSSSGKPGGPTRPASTATATARPRTAADRPATSPAA